MDIERRILEVTMALLIPSLFSAPSVKIRSKFFKLMHNCVNLGFHSSFQRLDLSNSASDGSRCILEKPTYLRGYLGIMVCSASSSEESAYSCLFIKFLNLAILAYVSQSVILSCHRRPWR